jgi:hypothetical protein
MGSARVNRALIVSCCSTANAIQNVHPVPAASRCTLRLCNASPAALVIGSQPGPPASATAATNSTRIDRRAPPGRTFRQAYKTRDLDAEPTRNSASGCAKCSPVCCGCDNHANGCGGSGRCMALWFRGGGRRARTTPLRRRAPVESPWKPLCMPWSGKLLAAACLGALQCSASARRMNGLLTASRCKARCKAPGIAIGNQCIGTQVQRYRSIKAATATEGMPRSTGRGHGSRRLLAAPPRQFFLYEQSSAREKAL